jgi:hypothetical protein
VKALTKRTDTVGEPLSILEGRHFCTRFSRLALFREGVNEVKFPGSSGLANSIPWFLETMISQLRRKIYADESGSQRWVTENRGNLGKSREVIRPKAWHIHKNTPYQGKDVFPELAQVSKGEKSGLA